MKHDKPLFLALLAASSLLFLAGCGKSNSAETDTAEAPAQDVFPEMEAYYATKVSLPAAVFEDLEAGRITQEEVDEKAAAGAYPRFFRFATPEDIPAGLVWEDGSDLPEIGSPKAIKGGTRYQALQDFPRTLRRIGPDSNGGFRPYILDDVVMQFARRHPNDTSIGPDGFRYIPGIAESWASDKANKTVYVKINPAARWSDGPPITADDMMFTFFFYQSSYIKAPWYNNFYNRNYSNITKYDDLTFSITLREAKPDFASRVLELEPQPRHFYREMGEDFAERYQWRFVPTSGAYVVRDEDIKKGRSIALTRLKDWWAKDLKSWRYRYNYDRIHFSVIRDTAKMFETFRKGELDAFGLNLAEFWYDKLPNDDPLVANGYVKKATFYNDTPRPTYGLWMNESRPFLDNRDVRVGIQYATNWDLVIEKFYRGDYTRMRTTSDGYGEFTSSTIEPRGYSVDKALESFAKAGFTKRDTDGVLLNAEGQRLSFTLTTGYEALKDILTILREEALKAGLEFRLEVLDGTAAWKKVQEKNHDIQFSAFGVSPEMYPRYWETYHSVNAYDRAFLPDGTVNPARKPKTQTNNLQSIADTRLDRLIEKYRASEDVEEMKRLAFEMEEILYEDASFSPGFVAPFYRVGYWRWIHWPDDFNVKISQSAGEYFLDWMNVEEKKETLDARRKDEKFPVEIKVYDQYK
ncbi:MAG: extracellular solute-binding protein [Opitutaceae bacterium]